MDDRVQEATDRVFRNRVLPVLLLQSSMLYKTRKFRDPKYVGDPRNVVKIFNDKGADEIVVLDIGATPAGRIPNYTLIEEIATEAFMPMAYGGGITHVDQARRILDVGVEKVVIGTMAAKTPELVGEIARLCGSQSIIVCIDVKKDFLGRQRVVVNSGKTRTGMDPIAFAKQVSNVGAGEIIIQSVDQDGEMSGYDLDLVHKVAHEVSVPVIALGGAGSEDDLRAVVKKGGASAAAAGSMFVFHGPLRAVLITYPKNQSLVRLFSK